MALVDVLENLIELSITTGKSNKVLPQENARDTKTGTEVHGCMDERGILIDPLQKWLP